MIMSNGWIALHRSMQDHWLWDEKRKYSKAEAWIDILMTANHAEGKFVYRGKLFICGRGELLRSLDKLRKRWGWSKSGVTRFLKLIEEDGMIVLKSETVLTRITVCRYNEYQEMRNDVDTQAKRTRNAGDTEQGTYKKDKKKEKDEESNNTVSDETRDVILELWDMSPKPARARSSKKQVRDAWRIIKTKPGKQTLIDALKAWMLCPEWKRNDGQAIQGLHLWIKRERWEDLPEPTTNGAPKTFQSGPIEIGGRKGYIHTRKEIEEFYGDKDELPLQHEQ